MADPRGWSKRSDWRWFVLSRMSKYDSFRRPNHRRFIRTSGSFLSSEMSNGAASIALGDLNNDGSVDLVAGHIFGGHISVFRNTAATSLIVSCPADIVARADARQCSALVSFAATANGDSGPATATCSPAPGS